MNRNLKIYLDTCCYGRPYDDQTQAKVKMESAAITGVIMLCKVIGYGIIGSSAVVSEIGNIRDIAKRGNVENFYNDSIDDHIDLTDDMIARAQVLRSAGLGVFDSYHLVCAETVGANFLLTTDVDFIKAASRLNTAVRVINPLNFSVGGTL